MLFHWQVIVRQGPNLRLARCPLLVVFVLFLVQVYNLKQLEQTRVQVQISGFKLRHSNTIGNNGRAYFLNDRSQIRDIGGALKLLNWPESPDSESVIGTPT
jgi:hypothetical protein